MDRNHYVCQSPRCGWVALRKESVDRNTVTKPCFQQSRVALRKESVDRNGCGNILVMSENVALRKESVDRNRHYRDDVSD